MTRDAEPASVPRDARWRFRVLGQDDVAALQRFFEANPEYFLDVGGEPPRSDEAARELDDLPPADMQYAEMLLLGVVDGAGSSDDDLLAMATIVSDLLAERVWHIGLFIVATALHGSGAAHAIYAALERWMEERGASWLRLGVVVGKARAERFWARSGFVQLRERGPVQMAAKMNLLRVMAKPLGGETLERYLALVARDRPEAS